MLRIESYLEFGCRGAVHHAVRQLELRAERAQGLLRVARLSEDLPFLTLAAEEGWLSLPMRWRWNVQHGRLGRQARFVSRHPWPDQESVQLLEPSPFPGENPHLRFNPESRLATPAQRAKLFQRNGYHSKTSGCPPHLFLEVHHIKFYCEHGRTVPENLVCLYSKCHGNVHRDHLKIEG